MRTLFLAYACSLLAASLLFPDLLIFHRHSFVWAHDPESPMHNVFALVSQWTHGGVALFDRFDHFSVVYTQLTSGMYTVVNVLLAAVYIACSPFFNFPAEAFHHLYSFGFHALTILLRTVGGYLLLRRLGLRPWIIVVALTLLNSVLSLPMYFGLLTNNLYSYLPLLVYFIWAFFEEFKLPHLLGAVLVLTVAIANSPVYAMGYFYMVVHFFIVSCLILSFTDGFWRRWREIVPQFKAQRWAIAGVLAIICVIMLPWAWMFKLLSHDFFIAGSGMDGTVGRFNHALNPLKYFSSEKFLIPLAKFPSGVINFTQNNWEESWVFMGSGVLFLSLIGLFASKHKSRWVFGGTFLLVVLANAPMQPFSPLSVSHWITALTNPFSFLLRTMHMPTLLLPFLLMPLAALGLQVLSQYRAVKMRWVLVALALVLLVADEAQAYKYARRYLTPNTMVAPRIRPVLAGFRPVVLDYQNPLHLPFREHLRALPVPADPPLNSPQNIYGLFYKYSPLERYFSGPNIYDPLPRVYKDMYADQDGQGHNFTEYYLNQDTRFVFLAEATVDEGRLPWPALLALHWERRIALVEGILPTTQFVLTRPQDVPTQKASLLPLRQKTFSFDLTGARAVDREGLAQYYFVLPKDFPAYVATGLFTQDINQLGVSINGESLMPVQGKITRPMEFDVNNVRQGLLVISLPTGATTGGKKVVLTVQQSGEILDLWRNEYDSIGMTFLASHDGWLVLHLPYDPKWRLTIDGKKAESYKVNKYFIGTPIAQGEHKVLVQYWPQSPLRVLMVISVLLTLMVLAGVIGFALRREHKHG